MAKAPATKTRSLMSVFRRKERVGEGADRRRHGRLKAGETLSSNIGTVRDLSAGGMKVMSRRKYRGKLDVALWDIHRGLRVSAVVVWHRRIGFRRHEMGLQFLDVTPEVARELTALGADN